VRARMIRVALALVLFSLSSGAWIGSARAVDTPSADLRISTSGVDDGLYVTWSATVTNLGPDTAVAVLLDGQSLGDLEPGASIDRLLAMLRPDECGGSVSATSSTSDPDLTNNSATYGLVCHQCNPDPLVLEVPTDFTVIAGDSVDVDATATGGGTCVDPAPPSWSQTAGPAVLPSDPYGSEDLSFVAPSGPATLTFVLTYDDQTRTLNITVLAPSPTFAGFLSPLPFSTLRKSVTTIPVKFLLVDSQGAPVSAAAGVLTATLTPGTTLATCTWNAAVAAFQCNLKTPKGLRAGNPYTITVRLNGFPLAGGSTTVSFK
jgi:hypothetical protein